MHMMCLINFHLVYIVLPTYIWTSECRGKREVVTEVLCVLYLSYFILWDERRLGTLKASLCCIYVSLPTMYLLDVCLWCHRISTFFYYIQHITLHQYLMNHPALIHYLLLRIVMMAFCFKILFAILKVLNGYTLPK